MKTPQFAKLLGLFSIVFCHAAYAQIFTMVKTRPPQVNTSPYKQIAIGDFVGPQGNKTEESLNLSDAIAASLFKANAQEILDRNALEKILFTHSALTTIDDKMLVQLKKKISAALLITGRIETSRVNQQQVSQQQAIVANGCGYMYYWKANCTVTVQIKVIDITTGKMVFTGPIAEETEYKTKYECSPSGAKMDPGLLLQQTADSAAAKVAHLLVPYKERIIMGFATGTMFKHPFKKLTNAITDFELGNLSAGLEILKTYVDDGSLKDNLKAQAHYNYGLALFITRQYMPAKEEFKLAATINPDATYQQWYDKMDGEQAMDDRLSAVTAIK